MAKDRGRQRDANFSTMERAKPRKRNLEGSQKERKRGTIERDEGETSTTGFRGDRRKNGLKGFAGRKWRKNGTLKNQTYN